MKNREKVALISRMEALGLMVALEAEIASLSPILIWIGTGLSLGSFVSLIWLIIRDSSH